MRVPQPDIIEHFGNADAVPQLPERCLSRKAGIVRCCPEFIGPCRTKAGADFVLPWVLLCYVHINLPFPYFPFPCL